MSIAIAAILVVIALVGAVVLAIGVPVFFGAIIFDAVGSRREEREPSEDTSTRIAVERGIARAFVLAGGAFWSVAAFAGLYSFRETGATAAVMAALIPLAAVAATLIVGWYYERFTAALLLAASLAVVAWGIIYQFELGVWMIMTFALLGPMLTASVLFWMARRDQEAFERATSVSPQLAFVFAARSSLG